MPHDDPAPLPDRPTSPEGPRPAADDPPEDTAANPAALPVVRAVDHGTARLLPDVDRPRAWLLTVDDAPQSYVDLDRPDHLEFEYLRRIAHVVGVAAAEGSPLDVLHLGGGGLSLPRHLATVRPGSRQRVVESDRALSALVAEFLPLPPGADVDLVAGDAREAVEAAPPASADVLVADVFTGSRVPARLASLEYVRAAARVLRPSGTYVANLADAAPFDFLRGQLAALAETFAHVLVVAEPPVLKGRRFGNLVVAASQAGPDVAELGRRVRRDAFPARVAHGAEVRRLTAGAVPVRDAQAQPSPQPPRGTFGVG
ncbi:spermidine synthase [Streptomyces sp. NPDC059740]|uniref:spermidine synthase n=1 Tax=Streptomyces sp. NPDC059740 TaxID=3346926 RepID=UPI00364BFD89